MFIAGLLISSLPGFFGDIGLLSGLEGNGIGSGGERLPREWYDGRIEWRAFLKNCFTGDRRGEFEPNV
jgi:hypothetical protein